MLRVIQDCEVSGNTIFDTEATVYSVCRVNTRPTVYLFLWLHSTFWQDPANISTWGAKIMAIAWNSSHSYKRFTIKASPRHKLIATLQNPFPFNVPLDKAVQWAWYYFLWFWIPWCICWSDILRASELGIGQRKPRWCHKPTMSRFFFFF
jgi:hypothetical protein